MLFGRLKMGYLKIHKRTPSPRIEYSLVYARTLNLLFITPGSACVVLPVVYVDHSRGAPVRHYGRTTNMPKIALLPGFVDVDVEKILIQCMSVM